MTATEHAEAILAIMERAVSYRSPHTHTQPAILAAVEAAMQDARAGERKQIVEWLQSQAPAAHINASCDDGDADLGWVMDILADELRDLAHKGTGDE